LLESFGVCRPGPTVTIRAHKRTLALDRQDDNRTDGSLLVTPLNLVIGAVGLVVGAVVGQVLRNLGFTIVRPALTCDDPRQPGCGSNPRLCGASHAVVFGPDGSPAEYPDCGQGPHTVVVAQESGLPGLEANARAQIMFGPSSEVKVTVMHFGSAGRIEAFDMSGGIADVVMMAPTPNVEQRFTLHGTSIVRIDVIPGSPTDHTLVLGWCH